MAAGAPQLELAPISPQRHGYPRRGCSHMVRLRARDTAQASIKAMMHVTAQAACLVRPLQLGFARGEFRTAVVGIDQRGCSVRQARRPSSSRQRCRCSGRERRTSRRERTRRCCAERCHSHPTRRRSCSAPDDAARPARRASQAHVTRRDAHRRATDAKTARALVQQASRAGCAKLCGSASADPAPRCCSGAWRCALRRGRCSRRWAAAQRSSGARSRCPRRASSWRRRSTPSSRRWRRCARAPPTRRGR